MVCRNNERAQKAKAEILQTHQKNGLEIPPDNLRQFFGFFACALFSHGLVFTYYISAIEKHTDVVISFSAWQSRSYMIVR